MRTRHSGTAILFLVLATSGVQANQSQNTQFNPADAIQGFLTDRALLGAETATIGQVRTDGNAVTVNDIAMSWKATITAPDTNVTFNMSATVPALEVAGLAVDGTGYSAESISIPGLELTMSLDGADEPFNYTMVFTDYVINGASWGAFPEIKADPAAPVSRFAPLVDWIGSQSYDQMIVAQVAAETTMDGDRQEFAYGPISGGPVINGRLAEFSYGPFDVNQTVDAPGGPQAMKVSYGAVSGKGIDLAPLVQLLTGNGTLTGPGAIMESATLDSLKLEGDGFELGMGPTVIENFTINPARGAPLMQQLDKFVLLGLSGGEPEPDDILSLILDIYGAYGFGKYGFSDIAFNAPGANGSLAEFVMEGVDLNGLKRFALVNGAVNTPDGAASLGSIELRDVEFPQKSALEALAAGSFADGDFDAAYLEAVPRVGGFAVRDVSVGEGLTGAGALGLGLLEINLSDYVNAIPTNIAFALKGLQLPVVLLDDPQATSMLTAMGVDPIKADASLNLAWEEASGDVALDHSAEVPGVGSLKVSAAMTGIPRVVFENPARASEAIATAAVGGATIEFTDDGITGFLTNMMAQQSGISAAQFAQGIAQQIQMQVGMLSGDTALAETIGSALRDYLTDPQDLEVTLTPAAPVALAQIVGAAMAAPQQIPNLLNFSIKANR